jgi:c-di-GMP-binding flagellar brake protein YcgR
MPEEYSVKRRHPRIFFSYSDKVSTIISHVDDLQTSFSGSILNISQGGLQLNQKRNEYRGLQPQDHIIIRRIIGINDLISLADIPARVVWLMDNDYLNHVVMGVEFTTITAPQKNTLDRFINTWLALHQEE